MHRIDLIIQAVIQGKMPKAPDVCSQIAAGIEHENISILYSIAADKHPVLFIKDRNTPGSVTGNVNDLQRTFSQLCLVESPLIWHTT